MATKAFGPHKVLCMGPPARIRFTLSLEGDLHEQPVGLLTRRVFLGPSSQIEIRFSDIVGVVSGYSGGAVRSSRIEILDSAFPKLE